jgi:Glycosyl transferase family 2
VSPKFSVIAVDYDQHVPREGMKNGLKSLSIQSFKDFELIICHDGPKSVPYEEEVDFAALGLDPIIMNTPERMNNWGHSSRDLAMRQATGEYFIHFNIDNIFFPNAFKKIADKLDSVDEEIVIFGIRHWKAAGGAIFTGVPPRHCFIDVMQLVASARIWKEIGYWYNLEATSDGMIYEDMCNKYPWVTIPNMLGDNF